MIIFRKQKFGISVVVRIDDSLVHALEDKLGLVIQRVIANARKRGVKPYDSEADMQFDEDSLFKSRDSGYHVDA